MIKRLLGELDYTFFAETSLILFVAVFVLVSIITLFRKSAETRQYANIVLDENNHEVQE